jgi:hypothetical protein
LQMKTEAKSAEPVGISEMVTFAISENRILTLGTEVLLGFQYNAFFRPGFERLSDVDRYLLLGAQALLLIVLTLLLASASYHRLAFGGHDAPEVASFANRMAEAALLPFAVMMGLDLKVVIGRALNESVGIVVGGFITVFALALWYGAGRIGGRTDKEEAAVKRKRLQPEHQSASQKIERMLSEIRVVLPGVQALLGFQFSAILTDAFERLPDLDKQIHVAALTALATAATLLMAPSAYHRLAWGGEASPAVLRFGQRCMLIAMVALSVGLAADLFVILNKVLDSRGLALSGAIAAEALMAGMWFFLPMAVHGPGRGPARA